MEAVWAVGPASVREIQQQLPERKRAAYTTVQTIIYRLEEKGAVRRVKKIGNAHIFEALVTRKAAHGRLIDELLNVFGGSPRMLMAQLVETGQLTLADIRELETTLATLSAGRKSEDGDARLRSKIQRVKIRSAEGARDEPARVAGDGSDRMGPRRWWTTCGSPLCLRS